MPFRDRHKDALTMRPEPAQEVDPAGVVAQDPAENHPRAELLANSPHRRIRFRRRQSGALVFSVYDDTADAPAVHVDLSRDQVRREPKVALPTTTPTPRSSSNTLRLSARVQPIPSACICSPTRGPPPEMS